MVLTAISKSIGRFAQNRAPIFCLPFDGVGARHPGMGCVIRTHAAAQFKDVRRVEQQSLFSSLVSLSEGSSVPKRHGSMGVRVECQPAESEVCVTET